MLLTAGYFTVNYFEYIFFFWLYYYFGQIRKMGMEQSAVYTTLMWITWIVMIPSAAGRRIGSPPASDCRTGAASLWSAV